jgi:hypothetical protein
MSDYLGNRKWLAVAGYGLGALSKPLFAIAPTIGIVVVTARVIDRVGKGVRGAPRDALVVDRIKTVTGERSDRLHRDSDVAQQIARPCGTRPLSHREVSVRATNCRSASGETCRWNGCITSEPDGRATRTIRPYLKLHIGPNGGRPTRKSGFPFPN